MFSNNSVVSLKGNLQLNLGISCEELVVILK